MQQRRHYTVVTPVARDITVFITMEATTSSHNNSTCYNHQLCRRHRISNTACSNNTTTR